VYVSKGDWRLARRDDGRWIRRPEARRGFV